MGICERGTSHDWAITRRPYGSLSVFLILQINTQSGSLLLEHWLLNLGVTSQYGLKSKGPDVTQQFSNRDRDVECLLFNMSDRSKVIFSNFLPQGIGVLGFHFDRLCTDIRLKQINPTSAISDTRKHQKRFNMLRLFLFTLL